MHEEPFFIREGDLFVPQPISRGPWDPNSLHGRVIAGLLGGVIERRHAEPGQQVARFTVDLWRLPTFIPIEVKTTVARDGNRIKVVDAECFAKGGSVGRASAVLLRQTEPPGGEVWAPPTWDMPPPGTLEPDRPSMANEGWAPMWETRAPTPFFGVTGKKRLWLRENRAMVAGEPLTPFQRVALASDFTSPLANSGSAGLAYINADITVYLARYPVGEWVGFEATDHVAADGLCVGDCRLYDESGPIGHSAVAGLAQKKR